MPCGIVVKFQYYAWNQNDKNLITTVEHQKILDKNNKCWWGRVTSMGQDKVELLKAQLKEGTETWVFLYCTKVPKKIHEDKVLWYRSRLLDIEVGPLKAKN